LIWSRVFHRVVATVDGALLAVCARSGHGIDAKGKIWPCVFFAEFPSVTNNPAIPSVYSVPVRDYSAETFWLPRTAA